MRSCCHSGVFVICVVFFSSTIQRIWRAFTVTLALALHRLRVFLYTLEISLYLCIYCLYEPTTSLQPSHLCSPLMQVILVCILCELWPFVDLEILDKIFVHPRNRPLSLQPMVVWDYNFTTTSPLIQPTN